jgi:methyl-accepting chemotaxis protein
VRKLAERSRVAAQEIADVAESTSAVAGRSSQLLDAMIPNIQRTADLVQEVAAATKEEAIGVAEIHRAVERVDQVTQQNSASAEELASTAEDMARQAVAMRDRVSFFRLERDEHAVREPAAQPQVTPLAAPRPSPTPEFEEGRWHEPVAVGADGGFVEFWGGNGDE